MYGGSYRAVVGRWESWGRRDFVKVVAPVGIEGASDVKGAVSLLFMRKENEYGAYHGLIAVDVEVEDRVYRAVADDVDGAVSLEGATPLNGLLQYRICNIILALDKNETDHFIRRVQDKSTHTRKMVFLRRNPKIQYTSNNRDDEYFSEL